MKILSISNMPIWPFGENRGIPSIFQSQKGFVDRGHRVYFLCPLMGGETRYSDYFGIHIHRFGFPFNFRDDSLLEPENFLQRLKVSTLLNFNWFFFQIRAFFAGIIFGLKIKPDIIYAHSLTSVLPAFFLSRIFRKKFIIRLYGTRQLYWRYKSIFYRIKELRDYLCFKIPADYFIITDDGNFGNLLAKRLGVDEKKIRYWRNGIEEEFYEQIPSAKEEICRTLNINNSSKIIISISRLIADYQVERLISSLVGLDKKSIDFICLIAGSGPEEKRLKEFVQKSNLKKRIIFLGMLDRLMLRKVLNAADIFVLLSRYHNCTNTMWEAMASGKCIVTTDTPAIKDILTSEKNAILVSNDDLRMLSGILNRLLENDSLRQQMGRNAKLKAREILRPWKDRIDKEDELLAELVKEK